MEKIKLLFCYPALINSGYTEKGNDLLNHFMNDERFEIKVFSLNWVGSLNETNMLRLKDYLVTTTTNVNDEYDIVIQLSTPIEFRRLNAKLNVLMTAGIEADYVSPLWNHILNDQKCDLLIIPSNFGKHSFLKQENPKLDEKIQIEIIGEGFFDYDKIASEKIEILDQALQNKFLVSMGQWLMLGDLYEERKQTVLLLKLFFETFKDRKDIGLILKTFITATNIMDFEIIKKNIVGYKKLWKIGEYPKVYLVHGHLKNEYMKTLYTHPKIKGFISTTSGEGWGRHIIDAAVAGLPIIAPYYSSYCDFLLEDQIIKLPYKLEEISINWCKNFRGFFEPKQQWAIVDIEQSQNILKEFVDNDIPKIDIEKQKEFIKINFDKETLLEKCKNIILKKFEQCS